MPEFAYELAGETLDAVRREAQAMIVEGVEMVSEEILSDGTLSVRSASDSIENAFEEARKQIPRGSEILEEKELFAPGKKTVEVRAFLEEEARTEAEKHPGYEARIEDVRLTSAGSKGFLGVGKKPNVYEIAINQPVVAEVVCRREARIRVRVRKSLTILEKTELIETLGKVHEGMGTAALKACLGNPDTTMSDSEMFSMFGGGQSVDKSRDKENWLFKTRFGSFQVIVLSNRVIDLHSLPGHKKEVEEA